MREDEQMGWSALYEYRNMGSKGWGTYKQYKNVLWKRYSFWAMPFLRFDVLAFVFLYQRSLICTISVLKVDWLTFRHFFVIMRVRTCMEAITWMKQVKKSLMLQ